MNDNGKEIVVPRCSSSGGETGVAVGMMLNNTNNTNNDNNKTTTSTSTNTSTIYYKIDRD